MTAQIGDTLFYKGEKIRMSSEPLNQYLKTRDDIRFKSPTTACWRGYFGTWEIKNNKLYLIDLLAYLKGYEKVGLTYVFPEQDEVFADWFTGTVRIRTGKVLKYVHMGYCSTFEKDILLHFKEGILIDEEEIDNQE